jgi:hypothetical protein
MSYFVLCNGTKLRLLAITFGRLLSFNIESYVEDIFHGNFWKGTNFLPKQTKYDNVTFVFLWGIFHLSLYALAFIRTPSTKDRQHICVYI